MAALMQGIMIVCLGQVSELQSVHISKVELLKIGIVRDKTVNFQKQISCCLSDGDFQFLQYK